MASTPPLLHQLKKNGSSSTPMVYTPHPSVGLRSPVGLRILQGSGGGGAAGSSASDEAIWRRLKEAGFDEEMIKRRDKAALIAYITKLECELYDYQHHMGLLILDRKELTSKYEEIKTSAELAEFNCKREQASHLSALAEAKKREESLKKSLGIEKGCTSNIEKALHELRAESAETKVAAESKLADAHLLMENAQKMLDEAQTKMRAAESLHAEATRYDRSASRKLQEVEAREDEHRRRIILSKSEWDAKETDISLMRQSINDTQKILQQEREKIRERQSFLNVREAHIFERAQELDHLEKELEVTKGNIDKELLSLKKEKSSFLSDMAALATREEEITKREAQLDKREKDLLIVQESLARKEHDEIQRLRAENESLLDKIKSELEAEFATQRKVVEDEMDMKWQKLEVREADISQREKVLQEKEKALELQLKTIVEKEANVTEKLSLLADKEKHISASERMNAREILDLQKEKEEIKMMKLELEKIMSLLADEKQQVTLAQVKLELTVTERNELLALEAKLKEEIDSFRAQKIELIAESEKLRSEKEKFECEWELIDEKKEELRREAELAAEERRSLHQYLKNEHDSLKLEKSELLNQFKRDSEFLSRDREEFMRKMEHEHSEWFNKIQLERDTFIEEINVQKRDLQIDIGRRRAEVEAYLKEREETFEREKIYELQKICSQKEIIAKELDHIKLEREMLNNERNDIAQDRELREKEWSEIKSSIDELNVQREKLQKQRELLHADREEIYTKIQHLKELEDLNIASANRTLSELQPGGQIVAQQKPVLRKCSSGERNPVHHDENLNRRRNVANGNSVEEAPPGKISGSNASPSSLTLSWVRKCADAIFRRSPEKPIVPSPPMSSAGNWSKKISPLIKKFEDVRDTPDACGEMKVNSNEQIHKNVADKLDFNASTLGDGVPSDGCGMEESAELANSQREHAQSSAHFQNINGQSSRATESNTMALSLGRKRLNDSPYVDSGLYEESNNYQKRRRQEVSVENIGEDADPDIVGPDETLNQENASGEISFNQTAGSKEAEICEVERNGNNVASAGAVGNGKLHLDCSTILKTGKKMPDTPYLKSKEKLSVLSLPCSVSYNIQKLTGLVASNEENFEADEDEEEEEEEISVKEKLWNFIIT